MVNSCKLCATNVTGNKLKRTKVFGTTDYHPMNSRALAPLAGCRSEQCVGLEHLMRPLYRNRICLQVSDRFSRHDLHSLFV